MGSYGAYMAGMYDSQVYMKQQERMLRFWEALGWAGLTTALLSVAYYQHDVMTKAASDCGTERFKLEQKLRKLRSKTKKKAKAK